MADTARAAARTLNVATGPERSAALNAIADAILARSAEIIAANEEDMCELALRRLIPLYWIDYC